jgi:hypothetical protein
MNCHEIQSPWTVLTIDYELTLKQENTAEHIRACIPLNLQASGGPKWFKRTRERPTVVMIVPMTLSQNIE